MPCARPPDLVGLPTPYPYPPSRGLDQNVLCRCRGGASAHATVGGSVRLCRATPGRTELRRVCKSVKGDMTAGRESRLNLVPTTLLILLAGLGFTEVLMIFVVALVPLSILVLLLVLVYRVGQRAGSRHLDRRGADDRSVPPRP